MNTPNHTTASLNDSNRKPMLTLVIAALMTSPAFLAGCSSTPQKPVDIAVTPPVEMAPTVAVKPSINEMEEKLTEQENASITELVSSEANTTTIEEDLNVLLEIDEAIKEIAETSFERPAKTTFKFGFDKQQLPAEEMDVVVQHGRFLSQHPDKKIQIHGHADAQGAPLYNQFLAKQRAGHVAELLIQAGAQEEQIEIISWGSDKPMTSGTHWKDHRRVEMMYDESFVVQNQTNDELNPSFSN